MQNLTTNGCFVETRWNDYSLFQYKNHEADDKVFAEPLLPLPKTRILAPNGENTYIFAIKEITYTEDGIKKSISTRDIKVVGWQLLDPLNSEIGFTYLSTEGKKNIYCTGKTEDILYYHPDFKVKTKH